MAQEPPFANRLSPACPEKSLLQQLSSRLRLGRCVCGVSSYASTVAEAAAIHKAGILQTPDGQQVTLL
jgi:hypothetical protein